MTASVQFDPARGFGVYLHWPYCARICPYCDFNVYAAKARDPAPMLAAFRRELRAWAERTGTRRVDSIFFGGGSPSLLAAADVATLIGDIADLWDLPSGAEITLEANPDDAAKFADFAAAGVTRLSIGLQSLSDARLGFLGRTHSAAHGVAAVEAAQGRFASVSIDMIYATPGQTLADWRDELAAALALRPDHLSLYELSIEPGAAFFHAVKRGAWKPADDDAAADLYELTQEITERSGYPAYEISNHARSAEHRSAHNTIYWRSGDWAGVGPGAHGRLTADGARIAAETEAAPAAYLKRVEREGLGWAASEQLDALAQAQERLAMGLRLTGGMPLAELETPAHPLDRARIAELAALGLVELTGEALRLTLKGRLAADRIAAELSP